MSFSEVPSPPAPPGWWLASDGNWYPPHPDQSPFGPIGYGYGHAPVVQGTNRLAIASLVLSFLFALPAVIMGHVALSQISRSGGRQTGRGLAIAGCVIGYGAMIGTFVYLTASTSGG